MRGAGSENGDVLLSILPLVRRQDERDSALRQNRDSGEKHISEIQRLCVYRPGVTGPERQLYTESILGRKFGADDR